MLVRNAVADSAKTPQEKGGKVRKFLDFMCLFVLHENCCLHNCIVLLKILMIVIRKDAKL